VELEKFARQLSEDETHFEAFIKDTNSILKPFESSIRYLVLTDKKTKTSEYTFLSSIALFDNLLDFSHFEKENKNTKKMLLKYLYNLHFLIFLYQLPSLENLDGPLQEFVSSLSTVESQSQAQQTISERHQRGSPVVENVMETLFSNPELYNLANELTQDLQSSNVDPMTLLQGLMSGNTEGGQLGQLVQNVTQKLEDKIANGQLDTDHLEQQAQKVMSSLPLDQLMKSLGKFN
jgi:hypothetical protein